jgi:uncharacterized protein
MRRGPAMTSLETPDAPRTDGSPSSRRLLEPRLVVIGLLGGLLSGLLGVGGGVIMVPALVLWAGFGQREAHAFSLGAIIPISAASTATYGIAGEVSIPAAVLLVAGSMIGARMGASALTHIDEVALKLVFGVFLVLAAALMVIHP